VRSGVTEVELPPEAVMLALIDVYFDRMQWFILLFHEPSIWKRRIQPDHSHCQDSHGRTEILASPRSLRDYPDSVDGKKLIRGLINEIRRNLLDISIDCRIEAVQVMFAQQFVSRPSLIWKRRIQPDHSHCQDSHGRTEILAREEVDPWFDK
jgi:hypothetical protein